MSVEPIVGFEELTHVFEAGADMLCEGDQSKDIFALLEGEAEVTIDGKKVKEIDSRKGDVFFGEMAILGDVRTATVTAKVACTVVRIPPDKLFDFLNESPLLMMKLMKQMAGRTKDINKTAEQVPDLVKAEAQQYDSRMKVLKTYIGSLVGLLQTVGQKSGDKTIAQLHDYIVKTNPFKIKEGKHEDLDQTQIESCGLKEYF